MKLTYRGLSYTVGTPSHIVEVASGIGCYRGHHVTFPGAHRGIPDAVTVMQYRGLNYLRWSDFS